jgi:hypothetical protein
MNNRAAEVKMLITVYFLLLRQYFPINSKEKTWPISRQSEMFTQICLATTQSKNRCCTDSGSLQKRQLVSGMVFFLFTLSLVKILFWVNSQRKKWTLGGGFQTPDYRGVYKFYPSEIYDLVKGLRGIHPIWVKSPHHLILLTAKGDSWG